MLWYFYGYFKGDDIDSYIDMFVCFLDKDIIVYSICEDENDEYYIVLKKM